MLFAYVCPPRLEECYIVVAGGSVKGVFLDLEKAKAELSKLPDLRMFGMMEHPS